ncbi:histidine phosphatase family protein [Allorhizobium sp. BGMRC 0089]|uniref:SixA phosphatase family protein n=1 Tax=Allorhizobium sonneratiae TaxID=2934936 RepID=UPI0020346E8B|nr:histidine phosphatase family protein [Allorhizobium sonneratiae]MCM2292235.1 histidine phosphatase family protein [Allorhizobium sonneratiae]
MIDLPACLSRIYLFRHAAASWPAPGEKDFDRALNDSGFAEAELVTNRAADRNYRPLTVISSTARRCRETTEAVRRNLQPDETAFRFVDQLYGSPINAYLEILAGSDTESIMLVGHNPAIEELFLLLAGPDALADTIPQGYPTAGFAVLDCLAASQDGGPKCRVVDFLQP